MFSFFKKENSISLPNLMEKWLDHHSIEIATSTAYGYKLRAKKVIEYYGNIDVKDLTVGNIQEYIDFLKNERKLSNTYINHHCVGLKLALQYGVENGYLDYNPMDKVAFPKRERTEIRPFTEKEMELLLQQNSPKWVRDSIIITYHTGMRLGEIFALEWADIDFGESFIMVQRSQSRTGSKVVIKTTKTPSGVRRIDIDSFLNHYLYEMKKCSNSKYVFQNHDDTESYQIPWNISTHVRDMCRAAGIEGRNFHTIRHTHATVLMSHGVHPKIVQERLGHSDTKITMSTYSHVSPTIQKEAVKVFENIKK